MRYVLERQSASDGDMLVTSEEELGATQEFLLLGSGDHEEIFQPLHLFR